LMSGAIGLQFLSLSHAAPACSLSAHLNFQQ
jgi:hypothetical protein